MWILDNGPDGLADETASGLSGGSAYVPAKVTIVLIVFIVMSRSSSGD